MLSTLDAELIQGDLEKPASLNEDEFTLMERHSFDTHLDPAAAADLDAPILEWDEPLPDCDLIVVAVRDDAIDAVADHENGNGYDHRNPVQRKL